MKVRITGCSNVDYWYEGLEGAELNVEPSQSSKDLFAVSDVLGKTIRAKDCEIIEEEGAMEYFLNEDMRKTKDLTGKELKCLMNNMDRLRFYHGGEFVPKENKLSIHKNSIYQVLPKSITKEQAIEQIKGIKVPNALENGYAGKEIFKIKSKAIELINQIEG